VTVGSEHCSSTALFLSPGLYSQDTDSFHYTLRFEGGHGPGADVISKCRAWMQQRAHCHVSQRAASVLALSSNLRELIYEYCGVCAAGADAVQCAGAEGSRGRFPSSWSDGGYA
jgi:hypothetical protein